MTDSRSDIDSIDIDTGTSELLCSVRERVATITFNRPEARNALSDRLTPALRRMIRQLGDDPAIGALLLTGAGTAFCAGGDVKGMGSAAPAETSQEERVALLRERQRTLTGVLVGLRKPTIAALPGPAAGAGLAIALACDIRIAAESAILATGYARIALTGDYGISWLLTRLAGPARARELMLLGERIDARRGEALGLINRVVPDADLQAAAFALARQLANGPGMAFAAIKDNLDHALTADLLSSLDHEAETMVRAARTPQHKEAVRAFVDKRAPDFQV
jgi:2-(1,2-epoxy-1,2-dihydrophenyl)acetyl-CoA isomerase